MFLRRRSGKHNYREESQGIPFNPPGVGWPVGPRHGSSGHDWSVGGV